MTAAYRIEVQRNLHHKGWPWEATVYPAEGTLAGFPAACLYGPTRDTAVALAQEWIRAEGALDTGHETLWADERGKQVTP